MRIPDNLKKCVVFIGIKEPQDSMEQMRYIGTAFIVSVPSLKVPNSSFLYIVTAKHVARKIENKECYLRANLKASGSEIFGIGSISWFYHPDNTWPSDVAVYPFLLETGKIKTIDYEAIPLASFLSDETRINQGIGEGDEVFMVGLFSRHTGNQKNIPIIRMGTIAMISEEPIQTQKFGEIEAYLIEARSIKGLSGSPVFVLKPTAIKLDEHMIPTSLMKLHLLGLMHGHWDLKPGESVDVDDAEGGNDSINTRRGMKENAQRGFLNGAPVSFGYRATFKEINGVKKRLIELNEVEAPIVTRAFDLFMHGNGAKQIAQTLNAEGFRNRQGKPWNKGLIFYLLKNETYTGAYVWNRYNKTNGLKVLNPESEVVRVPNHHVALIDQASFDRVQRMMKERAPEMKSHPRAVASQHLLSGLVFCAQCGAKMIASTAKSGKFVYYACQRKTKEGIASCSQKSFNAEKLEPCIVDTIKDRLLTKEILSKLVEMICEELAKQGSEFEMKRDVLRSQKEEIEKKLAKYYEMFENNTLNAADVAPRLRELNAEKEAISAELARLNTQNPSRGTFLKPSKKTVKAYVEDLRNTLNEGSIMSRKAFLNSFIRRINIKDSEAEIEYTCPIGIGGNRKNEVLCMEQIGSRGRARTYNHTVNSRVLYH
jgi:site-specific DNA recombinase